MQTIAERKPDDNKEWFVVKFESDGVIRSVPKSWMDVTNDKIEAGEKVFVFYSYWTNEVSEEKLHDMAIKYESHENSWQKIVVEVLASAKTIEELRIKELMAKNKVTDIDFAYQEDEGKKFRKLLKKKKLEESFTSGQEYSTTVEQSAKSGSESDDETLETPEKSMFGTKVNGSHSTKRKRLSCNFDGKTKTLSHDEMHGQSIEKQQDIVIAKVPNKANGHLGQQEVNNGANLSLNISNSFGHKEVVLPTEEQTRNTWYVVKLTDTDIWHVVPTSWINLNDFTCSYPPAETENIQKHLVKPKIPPENNWLTYSIKDFRPEFFESYRSARSVRRAAKEDEKEMDDNEEYNEQENSTERVNLKQKSATNKSVPRDEKRLANKEQIPYPKTAVSLTDAEIDRMDVKTMFKVLYRQNEEVLKSHNKVMIAIQSIPAATMGTSTSIQFMKHPFQITTLKKLNEIEEQLKQEREELEKATDQDKDKVLPAGAMTNQVLNFFNAQGGSTGHKGLCNILRNSLADEIQVHFNMKGTERNTNNDGKEKNVKLAFEELEIWRLIKDVVVTKYIHVDNYTSDKATLSCGDWLKGAPERIKKTQKKQTKKKHQNVKLKKKIRQEDQASDE